MTRERSSFEDVLQRYKGGHVCGSFVFDLGGDFKAAVKAARAHTAPGVYIIRLHAASGKVVYVGLAGTSLCNELKLSFWTSDVRDRGIKRLHVEWIAAFVDAKSSTRADLLPANAVDTLLQAFRDDTGTVPEFNVAP
jgi:hypothetical protein